MQFYNHEEFLYDTVTRFVRDGLIIGQPAIIIATPEHRTGFVQGLTAAAIDVAALGRSGQLILLDARETLGRTIGGELYGDATCFPVPEIELH